MKINLVIPRVSLAGAGASSLSMSQMGVARTLMFEVFSGTVAMTNVGHFFATSVTICRFQSCGVGNL
jgi:hypothetical protein